MMDNRDFFGIIKFFKNEEFLSQLCGGTLFCNTPEYYRLHDGEGVSDRYECCTWSFRKIRGDTGAKIVVNGYSIEELTNVTFRSTGMKDSWLHCWTTLETPKNEAELGILVKDIQRIRSEFGLNYAYIPPTKIKPFIEHIKTLTTHKVEACKVTYSDKQKDWSPVCKSTRYKYQREFRILIGECQELSTEPLIIQNKNNFNDFIMKNISIEYSSIDSEWIWFGIDGTREIVHNKERKIG